MADAPTYPPLPPRRELGMGLMYEPVEGFNADDMRAFVDADRAARASRPQPSQPLTDAQVGDLCGEANRGYCIESEHYFKAFRDAEEAHGITGRATPSPPVAVAAQATPVDDDDDWLAQKRQAMGMDDLAQPQPQPAQPLKGASAKVRAPLSDAQIEKLREATFSTSNPFCPCDSKTMRKAVWAAERAHGITAPSTLPHPRLPHEHDTDTAGCRASPSALSLRHR